MALGLQVSVQFASPQDLENRTEANSGAKWPEEPHRIFQ